MGLARWLRSWWWPAVGVVALLGALVITLVELTGGRAPAAEPVRLRGSDPVQGEEPAPETARIPGCELATLDLASSASPAFVGEPFMVSLTVAAADDCPVRARLRTVGAGDIEVTPDGALTRSTTSGTPAEFSWTLVADVPGRAVASVAILAGNDDVVADLTREVSVEPSRRRHAGTRWLHQRLDDLVVTATTADGRALRAGQPGLLTVQVRGPAPGPIVDGLDPLATLRACVELVGAGVSERGCWESSVDVAGPVAVQHRLPVRAERAGTLTMTGDLSLTGRVDGMMTEPVSTPLTARPAGNATVPVADRLRAVEQTAVRWLAVAGGAALVVGVVPRLVRWIRGGTRGRASATPGPAPPHHPRDDP